MSTVLSTPQSYSKRVKLLVQDPKPTDSSNSQGSRTAQAVVDSRVKIRSKEAQQWIPRHWSSTVQVSMFVAGGLFISGHSIGLKHSGFRFQVYFPYHVFMYNVREKLIKELNNSMGRSHTESLGLCRVRPLQKEEYLNNKLQS